jgi:hypothetical protein
MKSQKPTFPNNPSECSHKFWYCGDHWIAKQIPGYFDKHPRTKEGCELSVCRDCGTTRTIVLYTPMRFGIKAVA